MRKDGLLNYYVLILCHGYTVLTGPACLSGAVVSRSHYLSPDPSLIPEEGRQCIAQGIGRLRGVTVALCTRRKEGKIALHNCIIIVFYYLSFIQYLLCLFVLPMPSGEIKSSSSLLS